MAYDGSVIEEDVQTTLTQQGCRLCCSIHDGFLLRYIKTDNIETTFVLLSQRLQSARGLGAPTGSHNDVSWVVCQLSDKFKAKAP